MKYPLLVIEHDAKKEHHIPKTIERKQIRSIEISICFLGIPNIIVKTYDHTEYNMNCKKDGTHAIRIEFMDDRVG